MTLLELEQAFEANRHSENADAMKAYMKHMFPFYGIKSGPRRQLAKPLVSLSKVSDIEKAIDIINDLWGYDEREYQMVGVDVIIANKKRLTSDHIQELENWITTKSWWDTVDMIASHAVGELYKSYSVIIDKNITKWLQSDNIWLNRCCLLYQLKYHHTIDTDKLFHYIKSLQHKREFFIQKAIGWSLRQASKFRAEEIKNFIAQTNLSPLAYREGTKYLSV